MGKAKIAIGALTDLGEGALSLGRELFGFAIKGNSKVADIAKVNGVTMDTLASASDDTLNAILDRAYKSQAMDKRFAQNISKQIKRDALGSLKKLTESEKIAQNVLDLLRSGRADEVTEEMLELADDAYLYKNYDLPMDEASRMKRADEMGFDVDNVSYHGTKVASLDKFDPKFMKQGLGGKVLYSTDIPKIASGYAGGDMPYDISSGSGVLPLLLRGKRKAMSAADLAKGKNKYFENVRENIQTAKDEGFAGMDLQTTDPTGAKVQTTFDLSNVRSKFARFDPRLRYLKNLLASAAPVAVSLGALSQLKEEPQ